MEKEGTDLVVFEVPPPTCACGNHIWVQSRKGRRRDYLVSPCYHLAGLGAGEGCVVGNGAGEEEGG